MEQEVNAGHTLLKYDPLASKRLIEVLFFLAILYSFALLLPFKELRHVQSNFSSVSRSKFKSSFGLST